MVAKQFEARQYGRELELKRLEDEIKKIRERIDKGNSDKKQIVDRRGIDCSAKMTIRFKSIPQEEAMNRFRIVLVGSAVMSSRHLRGRGRCGPMTNREATSRPRDRVSRHGHSTAFRIGIAKKEVTDQPRLLLGMIPTIEPTDHVQEAGAGISCPTAHWALK